MNIVDRESKSVVVRGIQDFEGKDIILCWLFAVHRSSAPVDDVAQL